MPGNVKDKNSESVEEGDHVSIKIRGGQREGDVEKVVTTEAQAKKEDVKNPPKVREIVARLGRHDPVDLPGNLYGPTWPSCCS